MRSVSNSLAPQVLDALPVGVLAFNSAGWLLAANSRAESLLGAPSAHYTESHQAVLHNLALSPNISESLTRVLRQESSSEEGDGDAGASAVHYQVNTGQFDADSQVAAILTLTPRKATIDSAKFISIASHELKTPITALMVSLQLLERKLKRSNSFKDAGELSLLGSARAQTDRLVSILDRLLEASSLAVPRIQMQITPHNASESLQRVITRFESRSPQRNVSFQPSSTECVIAFDSQRFEQIVMELLENAARFSEPETTITVSQSCDDSGITVSVADTGQGISLDTGMKVFEMFYRDDSTVSGMGLGLYIASSLVHLHNGHMWYTSRPGQGSVFSFNIPTTYNTRIH